MEMDRKMENEREMENMIMEKQKKTYRWFDFSDTEISGQTGSSQCELTRRFEQRSNGQR